jgi:hypothetical protein
MLYTVKGLPEGSLFDIGVYTFSRPLRVAIYVLRTTELLADYDTVYLYLRKQTLIKIKKDSHRI